MVADLLMGGVAGLLLVGLVATGIPARLMALLPKKKAA
jgi:hypothetical protein